jgi:hypothetical protein
MDNAPSRLPIRLGNLAAPARSRAARRAFLVAAAAALLALLVGAAVARADSIASDVVVGGNDTIVRGGSTVWRYRINATTGNPDIPGCNAADGTPATLTIVAPAAVTVSPATLTFTQCGVFLPVTISSNTLGRFSIFPQVADAGGGIYNIGLASNILSVVAPANTAPVVTVTGVTNGATYQAGSVPAAGCNVVDAEDGNSSFAATLSGISGPLAGLGLGSQTASCTYRDRGGLSSGATATYSIVDTVPPVLTVPGDRVVEATNANGAVVSFSVSATDNVDPAPVVACSRASGATFGLGVTTVNCTATDAAGNVASGSFTVTVRDTTAPTLNLPGNLVAEATGPAGAAVTFSVSASDAVDPAPVVACSSSSGDTFPIGTTTVNCTATDASGNVRSDSFTVTVRDTTAPALHLPADIVVDPTGSAGTAVTFSVSATDAVDPAPVVACTPASGATFAIGATTVACTATDAAGNVGSGSFTVTVRDTTAPTLSLPSDRVVEATGPAGATVTFAVSATDAVDPAPVVSCTPASGATFGFGATTVNCTATDASGNAATGSFTVTVRDATAPTLNLPGDRVVEATGPAGAAVTFSVSATDGVDPAPVVSCAPASGATFGFGVTTVACTATDAAGNVGSGSFTVTVRDTAAPVFGEVPGDLAVEADGPDGAVVDFAVPTATDVVDGTIQAVCTPASGASFPLGPTTVTCTATDSHGNAASVAFQVSVGDTTPPVLTLPDIVVVDPSGAPSAASVAGAAAGAVVTFDASAFDLVDGPVSVTCTPASGSFFPVGRTTVLCQATDAAGNTAAGTFVVEVTGEPVADTTPPTIECAKSDGAWHPGDVEVGCIATDEGSGFAGGKTSQLLSLSTSVPAGTANANAATNSVQVCDVAGNCATAGPSAGHKVDKKAPANIVLKPNIPNNAIYILFRLSPTGPIYGSVPAKPTCSATDEGSGLASCAVAGHSTNVGVHTLTITATDKVGNVTAQKRTYAIVLLTWTGKGWKITVSSANPTSALPTASQVATFAPVVGHDAWFADLRSSLATPGAFVGEEGLPFAVARGDASADPRRPFAAG